MSFLCLRVDLDYVPWDTPDAQDFGHGEPAAILKLLDVTRQLGTKLHFFVSNRVLRAFPATADAVLNDGHDLDWLCKHPEEPDGRMPEALELFSQVGHRPIGLATKAAWPDDAEFDGLESLRFLSAPPGPHPKGLVHFRVETRPAREAARQGLSARAWTDATKALIRDYASRNLPTTVVVRPQVLARMDPRLSHLREILDLAAAVGQPSRTLREALQKGV